jgi:hypothetical protein
LGQSTRASTSPKGPPWLRACACRASSSRSCLRRGCSAGQGTTGPRARAASRPPRPSSPGEPRPLTPSASAAPVRAALRHPLHLWCKPAPGMDSQLGAGVPVPVLEARSPWNLEKKRTLAQRPTGPPPRSWRAGARAHPPCGDNPHWGTAIPHVRLECGPAHPTRWYHPAWSARPRHCAWLLEILVPKSPRNLKKCTLAQP